MGHEIVVLDDFLSGERIGKNAAGRAEVGNARFSGDAGSAEKDYFLIIVQHLLEGLDFFICRSIHFTDLPSPLIIAFFFDCWKGKGLGYLFLSIIFGQC